MNYAQKYDIFFLFFFKVVVNKSKGVFFSDNWYDAFTKKITSIIMLRFHFFTARALEYIKRTEVLSMFKQL